MFWWKMSKLSMKNVQDLGSQDPSFYKLWCHVHIEWFRYLKYPQGSVPFHILHFDIHFMHCSFDFSTIAFFNRNKMQPNFNLNYLSSMFLDLAHYDTTTTIFNTGKTKNTYNITWINHFSITSIKHTGEIHIWVHNLLW